MLWIIVGGTLLAFFCLLTFCLCKIASRSDRTIEFGRLHEKLSAEQEKAGLLVAPAFQYSVSTCYDFDKKIIKPKPLIPSINLEL
jgi:hypothetical protein